MLAISNHSNTSGYQRNEADICAVCELTQVLRDAIVEYQVGVNFEVSNQLIKLSADAYIVCTTKGNI